MDIVAALFVEGINQHQVAGPSTRFDLTGVMFSLAAPGDLPVEIAPHLVVFVRCPPDDPGTGTLEVQFLDADGNEVARNAQPVTVQPGKFGRLLVKGELTYESYGTIEAHVRLTGGSPVVVPLTLLPPVLMGRPFAAALSEHPNAAVATGDVVGRVLEGLGDADRPPDLAMVFVTPVHAPAMGEIVSTIRAALSPGALLGCAAVSVVGGEREVERGPAISLWAGRTGPVTPFHLTVSASPDGLTFTGWPDEIPDDASALLLIPDPFTFPTDDLLRRLEEDRPGMPVVGGMASAARAPGGNRLVIDAEVVSSGAVGAFLGAEVEVATVVSQGCRPVGSPFVVTRAEQNIVYELAGKPAVERLQEVAAALPEEDRELLAELVQIGRVIDERKLDFGPGDFLVRTVVGADPNSGALRVGDVVEVGSTAQFQVRDAASADVDLRRMVGGHSAQSALVFTCNGRGTNLFPEQHHDASVVSESLGGAPVAGMFCAGELGPIGGHNFMHGFTASVVLLSRG